jgi:hypothetical protein
MAFRFRKSVKIMPGVRLNISKGGLSTSFGVRGASATIGKRGLYANAGLPGTGISYRNRIDGGGSSRSSARSEYRSMAQLLREQERAAGRLAAAEEHAAHDAHLEALRSVLGARVTEPFPWQRVEAPLGPYVSAPFAPAEPDFSPETIAREATQQIPRWGWGLAATLVLFMALGAAGTWLMVVMGVLGGWLAWQAWQVTTRRADLQARLLTERRAEHAAAVNATRQAHEADEAQRADEWREAEQFRQSLATAVDREDPEPLAALLSEELSNEDLPVPLVFELEFENTSAVRIELALPSLDEVPEQRTQLTKTGKVSYRKMAQRDRTAIYTDLCCGLALRLVHETFRVLPMVEQVELFGTTEGIEAATGLDQEFIALHLPASREEFLRLDLDRVEAVAAVEGLGGTFSCNRRGELQPIDGVAGLLEQGG